MSYVVLTNPVLDDARIVVHVDALPEHEARGWEVVGPTSERWRDPLLSDEEQAVHDAEIAARAAALAAELAVDVEPAAADNVDDTDVDATPDTAAATAADNQE